MKSERHIIELPFIGGIDEKTRGEVLSSGDFISITNMVQSKLGCYETRRGYTALAKGIIGGGSLAATRKIAGYQNELVAIDGHALYSYSPSAGAWRNADQVPEVAITRTTVAQVPSLGTTPVQGHDAATAGGYTALGYVYGTLGSGAVVVTVFDATTGGLVYPATTLTNSASDHVMVEASGTKLVALYRTGASIYASAFDTAAPASGWSAPSAIVGNHCGTAGTWDACAVTVSGRFAVAYNNNSGGANSLECRTYNPNLTQQAGLTMAAGALGGTTQWVGVGAGTNNVWVAVNKLGGSSAYVYGLDVTTLALAFDATALICSITSATHDYVSFGILGTGSHSGVLTVSALDSGTGVYSSQFIQFVGAAGVTSPNGATTILNNWAAISKPSVVNGQSVAWFQYSYRTATSGGIFAYQQPTAVLVDITTPSTYGRPIGTVAPRLCAAANVRTGATPLFNCYATSSTASVAPVILAEESANVAFALVTADAGHANLWQAAEIGQALTLAGGTPTQYDGQRVSEIGFLAGPETPTAVDTAVGAMNGTFRYVTCYEWCDAKGQRHRSAPSTPSVATGAIVNRKVTVTAYSLSVTAKVDAADGSTPISIVIYRNQGGGSTYYRVGDVKNTSSLAAVTFVDNIPDASYFEPLYTTGGALPRMCPPAFVYTCVHKGRLFGVAEDLKTVWFSGQFVEGEGLWFNPLFSFAIDDGGPITGLASFEGYLLAFKRNRIFRIAGDGPPDAGGAGFGEPEMISADTGCIEARSIVTTPEGMWFRSAIGMHQLLAAWGLSYDDGNNIETTAQANTTTTSAVLLEPDGRVMFTVAPSAASTTGVTLVRDFLVAAKVWTTDQVYDTDQSRASGAAASACWASLAGSGQYYWCNANGQVYQRTSGAGANAYTDAGHWITPSIETGWLKTSGMQGAQRVRRVRVMAQSQDPHDLSVQIGTDYATSYASAHTFLASAIAGWGTSNEAAEVVIGNQAGERRNCQAIRVRLSANTPTGASITTGRGPQFFGLALEVVSSDQIYRRHPPAQRA